MIFSHKFDGTMVQVNVSSNIFIYKNWIYWATFNNQFVIFGFVHFQVKRHYSLNFIMVLTFVQYMEPYIWKIECNWLEPSIFKTDTPRAKIGQVSLFPLNRLCSACDLDLRSQEMAFFELLLHLTHKQYVYSHYQP